jgi:hypothetical protein
VALAPDNSLSHHLLYRRTMSDSGAGTLYKCMRFVDGDPLYDDVSPYPINHTTYSRVLMLEVHRQMVSQAYILKHIHSGYRKSSPETAPD